MTKEIRILKSEARNKSEIPNNKSETLPEGFVGFEFSNFEFVSYFDIRISNLGNC